ncbi:hypothetical protein [Enhygromyxa salina]|uniref:hypothetical protein n=1 Tax=Enhygromyxa salina TaxID=215803 RepID=UPI000D030930|nr:hypothetical protein [Enhygromyxa salina]
MYQLGLPPRRIDLLTSISGINFDGAWAESLTVETEGVVFRVPSRDALLINKRASGRPKDLDDVRRLEATNPLIDAESNDEKPRGS